MWARVVEFMLAVWLAISPFVFNPGEFAQAPWQVDLLAALLVAALTLASFWWPLRRAHLATILIGGWLVGRVLVQFDHPAPPAEQNHLVVGLLLVMFAIVPSAASTPPAGWQQFARDR